MDKTNSETLREAGQIRQEYRDKTKSETLWEAGQILQEYMDELKQLRKDASSPKQIAFLEMQMEAMPSALLLLGCAAGRDALKRQLPQVWLDHFDAEQNKD